MKGYREVHEQVWTSPDSYHWDYLFSGSNDSAKDMAKEYARDFWTTVKVDGLGTWEVCGTREDGYCDWVAQ